MWIVYCKVRVAAWIVYCKSGCVCAGSRAPLWETQVYQLHSGASRPGRYLLLLLLLFTCAASAPRAAGRGAGEELRVSEE